MTRSRLVVPRVHDGEADADTLAWQTAVGEGFLAPALDPAVAGRAAALLAEDRLRGVYEGERTTPVATLRSWDARLTVPGGDLAVDAVTGITVAATHRRRGLLRAVLGDDLAAAAAAGTPVAALTSTQGSLYERFGFGAATWTRELRVDTARAAFRDPDPEGTVELVAPGPFPDLAGPVADRARRRHPGSFGRLDRSWGPLVTGVGPWSEMTPDRHRRRALWRDASGRPAGYVVYRVAEHWTATRSRLATLAVVDLQATTPVSYRELWRHLCSFDLVDTVTWGDASLDEPLPWLLTDARAVTPGATREMLWLRVLDAAATLTARTYPVADRLRLQVVDDAGFAAGRWLVDTYDATAPAVERLPPGAEVDAVLPAASLASVCLGGVDPRVLARAGRLEESTPGAAGRFARLFAPPSVPWNGIRF